jgi:N-acetyl-gamma-glutamyl-phosphate reductase
VKSSVRAGIINVTGYIGAEIARLLHQHPQVELRSVTGRSSAGQELGEVFPHLENTGLVIKPDIDEDIDIAFSAMPHKTSLDVVSQLIRKGIKVIDVSADFRLKDAREYPNWYGFEHPAPELLKSAVYGLPEIHRSDIVGASLIANPGCYSTSIILALAPIVKAGLIKSEIVIDSKSGVSGAGRTPSMTTNYSEVNENISAYSLGGHRHLPEVQQELGFLNTSTPLSIAFVPHLVPITRGILSSCYTKLKNDRSLGDDELNDKLQRIYTDFYRDAPFVKIVDESPKTKHVWGSNQCLIYITVDRRTGTVIVICCIDNLIKGGAGQAVQNMNLMFDFPEIAGLEALAIYP